jgi:hypothetical protein
MQCCAASCVSSAPGGWDAVTNTTPKPSLGDVVSVASLVIGLLTALIYAAGWTYAYDYFARFRIPLLMIDLPFEHYLVYGGSVPTYFPGTTAFFAVLLLVALWGIQRWSRHLGRLGAATALIGLVILAFGLARWGGSAAARSEFRMQQSSDYASYPRVRLTIGDKSDLGDILGRDCGRLVASSRERIFLVRPVRDAPGLSLDTIVISVKEADAFMITAEYTSCK